MYAFCVMLTYLSPHEPPNSRKDLKGRPTGRHIRQVRPCIRHRPQHLLCEQVSQEHYHRTLLLLKETLSKRDHERDRTWRRHPTQHASQGNGNRRGQRCTYQDSPAYTNEQGRQDGDQETHPPKQGSTKQDYHLRRLYASKEGYSPRRPPKQKDTYQGSYSQRDHARPDRRALQRGYSFPCVKANTRYLQTRDTNEAFRPWIYPCLCTHHRQANNVSYATPLPLFTNEYAVLIRLR